VGSAVAGPVGRATRWTAAGGLQDLNTVFADLIPAGWRLQWAAGTSANGRQIVGTAIQDGTELVRAFVLYPGNR
jgi:hypothetical protein